MDESAKKQLLIKVLQKQNIHHPELWSHYMTLTPKWYFFKKHFVMFPFIGRYLWVSLCSLSSDMSLNTVLLLESETENISAVCELTVELWWMPLCQGGCCARSRSSWTLRCNFEQSTSNNPLMRKRHINMQRWEHKKQTSGNLAFEIP